MTYRPESNQSANSRFRNACKRAGLSDAEIDRFSAQFHNEADRNRMTFDQIMIMAGLWKEENGGGFRRSDR